MGPVGQEPLSWHFTDVPEDGSTNRKCISVWPPCHAVSVLASRPGAPFIVSRVSADFCRRRTKAWSLISAGVCEGAWGNNCLFNTSFFFLEGRISAGVLAVLRRDEMLGSGSSEPWQNKRDVPSNGAQQNSTEEEDLAIQHSQLPHVLSHRVITFCRVVCFYPTTDTSAASPLSRKADRSVTWGHCICSHRLHNI